MNIDLPENDRMTGLLKELDSNSITMEEFDKECAYWFISEGDLKPLFLPTRIEKMKHYDMMSYKERRNVPTNFWNQGDVRHYLESKERVIHRNRGMYHELIKYKRYIPIGDVPTLGKFDNLLTIYREFFNELPDKDRRALNWELYAGEFA